MTKFFTKLITALISAALILSSLSGNSINTFAQEQKNNQENSKKFKLAKVTQSESDLVETKVDEKSKKIKKVLKKPLTLGFTNSNNESQLNKKQKEEILSSLKKWKKQMPYDNKFFVTGMLPAGDSWVVYMMSSVPNPSFDQNKEYTNEDFETNDLRFIDTTFTVLLKNRKGNNWKAIVSNDSQDIKEISGFTEEELSKDAKNKLFGVDNPKNTFTETEDVLQESSSLSSISSTSSSNNLVLSSNSNNPSSLNSQSQISISSLSISSNIPIFSSTSSNTTSISIFSSSTLSLNSLKSISFLDVLIGSVKASAAESDYSWPWKAGETWNVNSGSNYQVRSGYVSNKWHAKTEEGGTINQGLDIMVPGSYWNSQNSNWNDIPVYAPKTGTITDLCMKNGTGGDNYFVRIDDMYIWHMSPQNFVLNTSVKKSQQIGTVAIGSNRSGNIGQGGDYSTKCGSGTGAHLHIKFMKNDLTVDGTKMTWENDSYSSFTSNNTLITDPNIRNVIPLQAAWYKSLDEGCKTDDGSRVYIWDRTSGDTNDCQRMRYNASNMTITNPYGKCMDAGNVNDVNNRWLRFSNCNNGNNQKWLQEGEGGAGKGRIWSQEKTSAGETLCIEYIGMNNGDGLDVKPCNANSQNQKFWYDIGITGQNVPSNDAPITDPNIGTILPPQPAWWKALDFGCKTANDSRVYVWDRIWDNNANTCQKMRYNSSNYTITNAYGKCLDSGDSNNNRWIRFSNCTNGNNQKWLQESQWKGGRIWSFQKNSSNQVMCMEYYSLDNNTGLDVNPCNSNQTQNWYPDLNITNQDIPVSTNYQNYYGKYYLKRTGTNQCLNINSPYNGKGIYTWDCIVNHTDNIWEFSYNGNGGNSIKRINTNYCLDSDNPSNGSSVYTWDCVNNLNQSWQYDPTSKMIRQSGSRNQCLAKWNPSSGSTINTWTCNPDDANLKWDLNWYSN